MLTRKENPAFPARIHRNPAKFTGTKRRKTAALPRILDPALCSNRFELLPRPRKHALRIGSVRCTRLCTSMASSFAALSPMTYDSSKPRSSGDSGPSAQNLSDTRSVFANPLCPLAFQNSLCICRNTLSTGAYFSSRITRCFSADSFASANRFLATENGSADTTWPPRTVSCPSACSITAHAPLSSSPPFLTPHPYHITRPTPFPHAPPP